MVPLQHAVTMEATRSGQSAHLGHEGHQATPGQCTPCPDTARSKAKVGPSVPDPSRLRKAKAFADEAIKTRKIFSVKGPYPIIRAALRARGWVEQRAQCAKQCRCCVNRVRINNGGVGSSGPRGPSSCRETPNTCRMPTLEDWSCPPLIYAMISSEKSDDAEKEQDPDGLHDLMSRLVRNEMVYFYWTNNRDAINIKNLHKDRVVNYFAKAGSFVTKAGLCVNLRNLHWFDSADPDTFFPRCYRPGAQDEKHAFIEDYRRTACTGFLKWIVEWDQEIQGQGTNHTVQTIQGQRKQRKRHPIPLALPQMVNVALKVCQEYLQSLEHGDIDTSLEMSQVLTQEEWAQFLNSYYHVVHGRAQIESSDYTVSCCKAMLQRLEEVCPQLGIDGVHNIWIIKPGAKSRGRGIKCAKQLDQILRLVGSELKSGLVKNSKWVVQKYIERPFLVYGTKFDVRQWFLVTNCNPLTVWFYKKCYLRFSTQPYSLDTLDRSVHLCNNSIQKKLKPSQQRHQGIPAYNMWLDDQFRAFLASQGKAAQWETVVVPGMKKAVIHALQTSQDMMASDKNAFELFGADFVLGCDLHPWLIEINASPTMAPSTPVTADLCAAVQEDTLRIVMDRRVDRTVNKGNFELIYKQAAAEVPQYKGISLLVEGFTIKNPNRSAPKCQGAIKENGCTEKNPPPLRKSGDLSDAGPTPPLPPEPSVPLCATHTHTLHLTKTVDTCVPLCDK